MQPRCFDTERAARGVTCPSFGQGSGECNTSQLPDRQQTRAVGLAIRVLYLFPTRPGLAADRGVTGLRQAAETLWANVTITRFHGSAGVDPSVSTDRPSRDCSTPNDTACVGVGLVFRAVQRLNRDGH